MHILRYVGVSQSIDRVESSINSDMISVEIRNRIIKAENFLLISRTILKTNMLGNISQLLEMKKKAEELKNKLEAIIITENNNGITVDCNGNRKILSIHIDTELLNDKTQLEDHMVQAINKALESAEKANMAEVGAMAGGMPGLMGLFGK